MEPDIMHRLSVLDDEASRPAPEESVDPRVSFEFEASDQPVRVEPNGSSWFRVRLFITPKAGFTIDRVERVVYVLHPTFSPNRVAVTDPKHGFAIQLESWGDFHAAAIVHFKDTGGTKTLIRYLPIGLKQARST